MDSIEQDLKGDEDKPLPHDIMNSLVSLGGQYRFVWIITGLIKNPGKQIFRWKISVLCSKEDHCQG